MEELFFFLFCQIQSLHEFHHVRETLVRIIRCEDDAVDAERLLGALKGDVILHLCHVITHSLQLHGGTEQI